MIKKIVYSFLLILIVGYLLLLSFWLNISPQKFTSWLEFKINSQIPQNYEIEIQATSFHIWGLSLNEWLLKEKKEEEEILRIESLDLRLNLVSILLFQEVPFFLKLYEGTVKGELQVFPELEVSFSAKDLQINRVLILRKTNLILSRPLLSIEGQIALPTPWLETKNLNSWQSKMNLSIEDLVFSGKTEHTMLPVELPKTSLKEIITTLALDQKQMTITLISKGDISATLKGTIYYNLRKLNRPKLNLTLRAELAEEFQQKLGIINEILKGYANQSGQLSVKISGNLPYPRFEKY